MLKQVDNNTCQYSIRERIMFKFAKEKWLFLSIIMLAVILRFYNLGTVPHGMTWDEAAIGYTGYSILHTRRDEWLERLPVSFKSFGDYKAPLAIYTNGIFTTVFGMNALAVRLPFALAGVLAVIAIYFFARSLFKDEENKEYIALLTAAMLAITPWHVHFSRIAFESGLALVLLISGIYFFIKLFSQSNKYSFIFAIMSSICLAASMYAYHSAKLVTPLLLIFFCILYAKNIKNMLKEFFVLIFSLLVLLIPLIKDSIWGHGLERAGVSVFSFMPFSEAILVTIRQFFIHFSPQFLIFGQTNDLRHGDGVWGVLTLIQVFFIIWALLKLITDSIGKKRVFVDKIVLISLAWIGIGILPAAISQDVPHSNRALLALPGFILLSVFGFKSICEYIQNNNGIIAKKPAKDIYLKLFLGITLLIQVFLTISYLNNYYVRYNQNSADAFLDGYIEAFQIAQEYEKGLNGKPEVEKVLFTSEYGQPYIYALFVRKTSPIWYRGGSLVKYEFTDKINSGDLDRDNTLIVAGKSTTLDYTKATHIIKDAGGNVRFALFLTENKE